MLDFIERVFPSKLKVTSTNLTKLRMAVDRSLVNHVEDRESFALLMKGLDQIEQTLCLNTIAVRNADVIPKHVNPVSIHRTAEELRNLENVI